MPDEERGVAFEFWSEVEKRRLELGWEKQELAKRSTLARSTINDLRSGTRAPKSRTVHALADLLHIDRREAEQLAGLIPRDPKPGQVSIREAIAASTEYSEDQKTLLLQMIDTIEQANRVQHGH